MPVISTPGGVEGAVQEQAGSGAEAESVEPIEPGLVEPPAADLNQRNGLAPGQDERKVERAAQITLSAEEDEVPDVADGVIEVSDRYDGIVVSSQVSENAEGRSTAHIELAIPAAGLQDALADLSELADVSSRSESAIDVTEPFVTARERLADARAELDALLTQLADADTPRETRSIRARMDIVRGEIAAARAELEDIARRARFARVSVDRRRRRRHRRRLVARRRRRRRARRPADVRRRRPRQPRGPAAPAAPGNDRVAGRTRRRRRRRERALD